MAEETQVQPQETIDTEAREDQLSADGEFSAADQLTVATEQEAAIASELHTYEVGGTVTLVDGAGMHSGETVTILQVRENVFPTPMYYVRADNGDEFWVLYEEVAPQA